MLFMCYQAYIHLKETSWKHICLAFWGAVIFVLLAEKLVDNSEQFTFPCSMWRFCLLQPMQG